MKGILSLWLPPLAWAGVIFGLSSWSGPEEPPRFWFPGLDKMVHAALFAVLAALLFRALAGGGKMRAALLAAVITALYGATDEWHQSFNASRSVEVLDFIADSIGGLIGAFAGFRLSARWPFFGKQS